MNKHIAPVALSIGLLGIVGGVAAANAFSPSEKPAQRQVEVVVPAAETVTPEPVTTTAAPVVVTPKPVQSVKAKAPAKAPVQRRAVVSEPQTETPATGSEAAARGNMFKPPPGAPPAPSETPKN